MNVIKNSISSGKNQLRVTGGKFLLSVMMLLFIALVGNGFAATTPLVPVKNPIPYQHNSIALRADIEEVVLALHDAAYRIDVYFKRQLSEDNYIWMSINGSTTRILRDEYPSDISEPIDTARESAKLWEENQPYIFSNDHARNELRYIRDDFKPLKEMTLVRFDGSNKELFNARVQDQIFYISRALNLLEKYIAKLP